MVVLVASAAQNCTIQAGRVPSVALASERWWVSDEKATAWPACRGTTWPTVPTDSAISSSSG